MNDAGESCYPSIMRLCRETSLSNRAVITHLRAAAAANWIGTREHGFSGQEWARKEYFIQWPDDAQGSESGSPPPAANAVKDVHHLGPEGSEPPSPSQHQKAVKDVHHLSGRGSEPYDRKAVKEVHTSTSVSTSVNTITSPADEVGKLYLTKRKRKLTGWKLSGFLRFWKTFAYKHGKAEAADAWLDIPDLSESKIEEIVQAAAIEARLRPALVARGGSPKWAQGWVSARRYEDEALQPAPPKGTQSSAPDETLAKAKRHGIERLNDLLKTHGKSVPPCSGGDSDA